MLRRRLRLASLALLAAGCGNDQSNPFNRLTTARPPSADSVVLFVSGSWASGAGQPRELMAANADGSKVERLTGCAESDEPCDFLQVAPSPDRGRIAAVRTTPTAEPGRAALYFMDLSRGVQTMIVPLREVQSVDWSPEGSFLVYTAADATTGEDLYYTLPNGSGNENLTQSAAVRERSPRIDPLARTAVFERIDASGVGRIYIFRDTPVTSGAEGGEALPGTPYVVGADADPVYSPDGLSLAFRRLTGTGNGGLGTWDVMTVHVDGTSPQVVASGPVYRGAPDWGTAGIVFVETDMAASESRLVVIAPDGTGRTVLHTEDAGFRMSSPRWLH
jgi:Tol biopolymer transport system component